MIPEALAGELFGLNGTKAGQDGGFKPGGHAGLWPWLQDAVDGSQDEIFADRDALMAFADMLVDEFADAKLLGELPKSDDGAEVADMGIKRLLALEPGKQVVGFAQMRQDNRPGLTVNASAFDNLPVMMSADGLPDEGRHKY